MNVVEQIVEALLNEWQDTDEQVESLVTLLHRLGMINTEIGFQHGRIIVAVAYTVHAGKEHVLQDIIRQAVEGVGLTDRLEEIAYKPDPGIVLISLKPQNPDDIALAESIAVDLDGTLAKDTGWKGVDHIGEPVKPMLDLVKKLLDDGEEVVIFTARAHDGAKSTKEHIAQWLKDHDLPALEITNEKRPDMDKFYDDKAVAVKKNRGPA